MKIFKLNYLAFSLLIVTALSCATEEVVADNENAETVVNNEFTFSKEIDTYEINGKLVNDRTEIITAAENAWHVLYDYPNKRVSISTTPQEFEKLKNTDAQIKASFDAEQIVYNEQENVMIDSDEDDLSYTEDMEKKSENEYASRIGVYKKDSRIDINSHNSESDVNDIVLHSHVKRKYGNQLYQAYYNIDLYTVPNADVSRRYHFASNQVANFKMQQGFTSTRSLTTEPVNHNYSKMINHSKKKRRITFYSEKNYKGAGKSFVLNPNAGIKVRYETNFNIPNRPVKPENRIPARSIKVVNLN